ncbi:MAG TPA: PQQ-binding-like beta-propeller repeat protein [Gemmatimonadaceae bacterium]|nr:PQQ-binding-like beta-propeller repeat protein [Gemmatimonadaceae bacterium]
MLNRGTTALVSLFALLAACTPTSPATSPAPLASADDGTNWPTYNRTLAGDRYSPLSQINRSNVAQLRNICTYTLPEVTSLQTGPLVIDGTMYFTTDTISYAIDASNCAERWRVARHSESPSALLVNRGFAYMNGRLFRGTSDAHVLAMDAATGKVIWDHVIDLKRPGITIPMAPIAANGLVYIGNAGGDQVGVTGHVYAYDASDGHSVWRFDVVPASGPARATWSNPRLPISGGAFWTSFTMDALNGVLYVPAGNPAPDFDAELRTGDNLYSNSVIALDASTGRMLAYNQLVKRDNHDWDVDSPPTLVTNTSGRAIVASANKDGLLSILDRSRLTGSAARAAGDLTSGLVLLSQTATTTRRNVDVALSRDTATIFCPGIQGGVEWNGAAYSPQTNALYVGAVDWCTQVRLNKDTVKLPEAGGTWLGNANTDLQVPADQARGWVTAFDAENGAVKWKFQSPHPILAGVTPTAGGLLFAANLGGDLYAFDVNDGRVLWQHSTGQSNGGGIVTYAVGGRQRVAIASGMKSPIWPGGAQQSRIQVYGLP